MGQVKNLRIEQQQMLDDCLMRESKLNEWECDFIQSVNEYFLKGGFLSDRQEAHLRQIWERVMNGRP